MSTLDLQRQGQKHYAKKSYKAALETFNLAIKNTRPPVPVSILDNRAATYEKLGEYTAALRDGKTIIEREKQSARGYLRVGKTLLLMGRKSLAQDIYERGVCKVPKHDDQHCLLKAMLCKLSQKTIDPLEVLPPEISATIFETFTYSELIKCLAVCRPWRDFLQETSILWKTLDLTSARQYIRLPALRACISRAGGQIAEAKLGRYASSAPQLVKLLATQSNALSRLEIIDGFSVTSIFDAAPELHLLETLIVEQCAMPLNMVANFLRVCTKLQRAEFGAIYPSKQERLKWPENCPSLRAVRMQSGVSGLAIMKSLDVDGLAKCAPELTELRLGAWEASAHNIEIFSQFKDLEVLDISWSNMDVSANLPKKLRSLCFNSCLKYDAAWNKVNNFDGSEMASLEEIKMHWINDLTAPALIGLLRPSPNFRRLNIAECPKLDTLALFDLLRSGVLRNVTDLSMTRMRVDDDVVAVMARECPRLHRVDLSQTEVTGVGVKELLIQPHSAVEWLNLTFTPSVSIDAVEWARSKGVAVEYKLAERRSSGKKVRYG